MTESREPVEAAEAAAPTTDPPAPIDPATAWSPAPSEPDGSAPAAAAVAGRSSRTRWIVAGIALVLVAGLTIGAGILLTSRATPEALGYIPSSMTVVADVRMDLPGDQLQKVGNLLAHFPGFKDQSTLTQKLSESLSKLTTRVSGGKVDYATKVEPWLAGPLFAGYDLNTAKPEEPNGVIVATTNGKADCATLFTGTTSTQAVGSLTMLTEADGKLGCLLDGRFALVGAPATIQAAMDAHGGHKGMDQDATYRTAREALGGDQLATFFLSGRLYAEIPEMLANMPGASELPANPFSGFGAGQAVPTWVMAGVRAEDDALVYDAVAGPTTGTATASGAPASTPAGSPLPSLLTAPPDHASRIAPLVPGDALAMADAHGLGIALENVITLARSSPQLQAGFQQIDASLQALGGTHQLVGWVEDAGVVIIPDGTTVAGGVILLAPDEATATSRTDQLLGFFKLYALSANLQVHDETIAGTKVTFIDGNLGSLVPGSGLSPSPSGAGTFSIAVAVHGSAVYVGSGSTFAHKMLELASGSSLADQAGYQAMLKRTSNTDKLAVYVALAPIVSLADGAIPAEAKPSFDADVKPYLDPLNVLYASAWQQGELSHMRLLITVK